MSATQLRRAPSLPLYCAAISLLSLLHAKASVPHALADRLSTTLINRDAIVYSAVTGKVYAVDENRSAVWVIEADDSAKSVKVGAGPEAIAVNPSTGTVYVASSGDRSVSVLDGKTDALVATVPTAARPYAMAVDELTGKVYVSNTFSNMLTVIDGATNTAANVKAGSADAIVVDARAKQVYLLGYESDTLTVLDTASGDITKIPAGATHLWGMALDKTTGMLYLTHVNDGSVAALDVKTHRNTSIAVGAIPCAIAVNDETGKVYVANYADGTVTVLDEQSERVVATVA